MLLLQQRRGCSGLVSLLNCSKTSAGPPQQQVTKVVVFSSFTSSSRPRHDKQRPTPSQSNLNNTLLNSLLHKDKSASTSLSPEETPPAAVSLTTASLDTPKPQALKYVAMGVPIYFGLWVVTCGSVYTAVKTNSLDTHALFGMDRSYAVDQVVTSIEWYTSYRLPLEHVDNPEINDFLLAASITKLTSPFRLLMTMMLMNRS